ncbi:hypothetical protein [Roseateles microcysteis]|uniref:hypothetical protein n=1 Tax=Roseateles microcysteis TaxID=3119057 RepID=UPI002FE58ECB
MARYLIQSGYTFEFLHWDERTGGVNWTPSLAVAIRHGVASDLEEVDQLMQDHCDPGQAFYVDLDMET